MEAICENKGKTNLKTAEKEVTMAEQYSYSPFLGHIDTIILRFLLAGDSYGFEIQSRLLEITGEQHAIKETTLYSNIKRLEANGLLASYWGNETQGARRKYYRLTAAGKKALQQNIEGWKFAKKAIDNLLGLN
jgi:PadR family transcriptional regulator PadR